MCAVQSGTNQLTAPAGLVARVRLLDGTTCEGTPRRPSGERVRLSGLLLRCSIVLRRPFSVVSQHLRLGDPGSSSARVLGFRGSPGPPLRVTAPRASQAGAAFAALPPSLWTHEWILRLSASVKPLSHAAHLCRATGKPSAIKRHAG